MQNKLWAGAVVAMLAAMACVGQIRLPRLEDPVDESTRSSATLAGGPTWSVGVRDGFDADVCADQIVRLGRGVMVSQVVTSAGVVVVEGERPAIEEATQLTCVASLARVQAHAGHVYAEASR